MAHWLFKSEPDVFGIDHLERDKTTEWSGVRNYTARNFMQSMKLGELAFFYHSNAKPPGIAGICKIVKLAHPDSSQFDPKSEYYDPKSPADNPRWWCVDVGFILRLQRELSLDELKAIDALEGMPLLMRGQRLSVQPVEDRYWKVILKAAGVKASDL